jgi:hypothetical protein
MNSVTRNRLDRRTLLRGAGSIAVALPWLEAMGESKLAHAQAAAPATRFLTVYTPGGTVQDKFWPTGPETAPVLSPILAPLEPVKSKLLVLKGLDMPAAVGEQHQAGIIAWLTGSKQTGSPGEFSSFPSIDQVIATRISKGKKQRASYQMAVRWATGRSKGLLHPINCANFEDSTTPSPIAPQLDPQQVFGDLFGNVDDGSGGNAVRLARERSILDHLDKRYTRLGQKLGAADRAKLDQHLTKIRELETQLDIIVKDGGRCAVPPVVDTSKYNHTVGLNITEEVRDQVQRDAISTDEQIPAVGKWLMDMMVMALACDITAVGSLQWTDTEAKHTFPWLLDGEGKPMLEHHHFYQHDGGFRPVECETIYTWYSQQHAYLLQEMDKVDMGGHSLLDESVVFFGSELAMPPTHVKNDMPFMLAGAGGGLKGGRHVSYGGRPHNDLLVAILNLFGDERTSYGHEEFMTGAITNLTG